MGFSGVLPTLSPLNEQKTCGKKLDNTFYVRERESVAETGGDHYVLTCD